MKGSLDKNCTVIKRTRRVYIYGKVYSLRRQVYKQNFININLLIQFLTDIIVTVQFIFYNVTNSNALKRKFKKRIESRQIWIFAPGKPLNMTRCSRKSFDVQQAFKRRKKINPSRITSHSELWAIFTIGRGEKTPHTIQYTL